MIITIDGPAGSGKSTVAKLVADRLGYTYIDTGAMYRAVAYKVLKENLKSKEDIIKVLDKIDLYFDCSDGTFRVILDGEDITDNIRTEEVGKKASEIAKIPEVRERLVHIQREIGKREKNAVLEGRDTGTVVFPDADIKFFLTASPEERARRRYLQLKEKGVDESYENILKSVLDRDKTDTQREISPLKPAKDAIIVDTTDMSIEEVVNFIIKKVKEYAQ